MQSVYHEKAVRLSASFGSSVCLWNLWIVTKRKKFLPIFLYQIKERLFQFFDTING